MNVILLCHSATASMRSGAFPSPDEPLDAGGERRLPHWTGVTLDRIVCSPGLAARQTADALTDAPEVVLAVRDIDHGSWAGRAFADVHAENAAAFEAWLARPWDGAPDGETFADLCVRVDAWFEGVGAWTGTLAVVTHPMVVRGFLAVTIGLQPEALMRIDVAPLTAVTLSHHRGWRLQRLGETLFG